MEHQHQKKNQQRQQLENKRRTMCVPKQIRQTQAQINQFENILIEMHYAFICHRIVQDYT